MKKPALMICAAAMTLTGMRAEAASPLRPMTMEAPSLVHQIGHRGFYGGRGYGWGGYRGGWGGYHGGYGGYHGGWGHHDNFWVPGAAFLAGAIIGGVLASQYEPAYEPEYRPIYRPYRVYRPHRIYRPYRAYRSYPVYDHSYGPCNAWRQDC